MRYFFWPFLILLAMLRIAFFFSTRPNYPDGTRVKISDRVTSEPIRYETSQRVFLQGFKFYLPLYPEINYGDEIVVEGVVDEDKLKNVSLSGTEKSGGMLYVLRNRLVEFYQRSLPCHHSALIAGITIGSKANIPSEFWEKLKMSGTVHVVVASGMNVTLVAGFLMGILIFFIPRRKAIPLALVGIWSYAILSGFDAPIIRAAVMGSIAFTAQEIGRLYLAWRALVLSALAMIFIKPDWIVDLGFILSFVATASLMLFEARIRKFLHRVPSIIRQDLSTTLAAQIGVAPILFASFGQFNVLSPLVNALILWTIPPITIIGMIGGTLGMIFEPAGRLVLLLSYPLTSWFILMIQLFG
jgi:ComEC/Rec2-related protein